MSSKFSSPFMNKSPLRDAKFNTSLQPKVMDPTRNINMTEQERVEGREALTDAVVGGVTLNPTFAGVSTAGKGIVATAKAIGSGGLRNLIAKNSNKILGFFAKKLGLKGSTTGVNSTRSLNM
tara:strand:+ start:115 stop:480 length:366 start_codon:yes stop_codon:yes gene_type:complete